MASYTTTSQGWKVTTAETPEGRELILRILGNTEPGSPQWHQGRAIELAEAIAFKNPNDRQANALAGHLWKTAEGLLITETDFLEPEGYKVRELSLTLID